MPTLTERQPASSLQVAVGQHTEPGRKPVNQDFHGLCVPAEPLLGAKGIAIALADGISSSNVSHIASETAVASFLEDYYCTPETWSVKKSAHKVLSAANGWLHAQTRQRQHPDQPRDADRGYVCTMTVMVLKATTAHILHIGDARIYRLRGGKMEQLTDDHRVWISQDKSYLGRALGLAPHLEWTTTRSRSNRATCSCWPPTARMNTWARPTWRGPWTRIQTRWTRRRAAWSSWRMNAAATTT